MSKKKLLISGDLHLRETNPACWKEDYMSMEQKPALDFIKQLARKNDNPWCIFPGDIFHHWKASPWLLRFALLNLPSNSLMIPGQHDLPNHNLMQFDKSGISLLRVTKLVNGEDPPIDNKTQHYPFEDVEVDIIVVPFGEEIPDPLDFNLQFKKTILVTHRMTWYNDRPWVGCDSLDAISLMKKHPKYDLIITGDNHERFVANYKKRFLVNAGSVGRMTIDQCDHQPAVYLYDCENHELEAHEIPIQSNVMIERGFNSEVESIPDFDEMITMFKDEKTSGIKSFRDSVKEYIASKKDEIEEEVIKAIWNALEGDE